MFFYFIDLQLNMFQYIKIQLKKSCAKILIQFQLGKDLHILTHDVHANMFSAYILLRIYVVSHSKDPTIPLIRHYALIIQRYD